MTSFLSLDRFIVFYLSPGAIFLVSLIQFPLLGYFFTSYVEAFVLSLLVLHRLADDNRVTIISLAPIIVVSFLCSLEYLNYILSGQALHGMEDIRMIFYSPLFGPIIVFVLYATYLSLSPLVVRFVHLNATIKYFTYFNLFFIFYWLLLYVGIIPHIEATNYLNANNISYAALFVIFSLIYFRGSLSFDNNAIKYFLLINIVVIFLNTTRGAILIFFSLLIYGCLKYIATKFSRALFSVAIGFVAVLFALFMFYLGITDYLFRDEYIQLYNGVTDSSFDFTRKFVQAEYHWWRGIDEAMLSSFARVFANYFAVLAFLSEPLIGAGTPFSYSINVFGMGIHSFDFLLLSSTGIVGVSLFVITIIILSKNLGVMSNRLVLLFFALLVLLFINSLPVYFVLLFVLGAGFNACKYK